jgi:hypothetical protein
MQWLPWSQLVWKMSGFPPNLMYFMMIPAQQAPPHQQAAADRAQLLVIWDHTYNVYKLEI